MARPILIVSDDDEELGSALRQLGAEVIVIEPYAEVPEVDARVIVVMTGERLDLAASALRHVRRTSAQSAGALLCVHERQVTRVDPASGFDDFVVLPASADELYARVRQLEWRRSEFINEEQIKMGALVVDRATHGVTVAGARAPLTKKEYALLTCFLSSRGRVLSRDALLAKVWGRTYAGGPRTVDIHVRRLRAKLGDAFPLETVRGAGYLLRAPIR